MSVEAVPKDNIIIPFQLERSNLRGRIVRMGAPLHEIITAHSYPEPVSHLVAEAVTLSLCLSSMLKYDGIFTLQAQGDGPVGMLAADVRTPAFIRGCASFNEERVEHARERLAAMSTLESSENHLAQYLGKGYIAFTVDQGEHAERYQGIVELEGASLIDCVQHYFRQSEQIATGIRMAVGPCNDQWRGTAIMLQNMPDDDQGYQPLDTTKIEDDDWLRSMVLMQSATEEELLDKNLSSEELLFRLFHEEGVRVYEPLEIVRECRCSLEKVQNVIRLLPDDDREYMIKDGRIELTCEFCSKTYGLDPKTLDQVH